MSYLTVPIRGGWLDSRIPDIAKRLRERDPNLSITARCSKDGTVQAYEAWWKDPNGKESRVASWGPHEVDRILHDVALMDAAVAGHVPAIDRIEAKEAKMQKDASDKFLDTYNAMIEHWARLERDIGEGKHFFPMYDPKRK
jgi:hypothetical protein